MRSLRVLRAIRSSEEVQTSLETFGVRVADRLDRRRGAPADGEANPVLHRQLFAELGRDLRSLRGEVIAAEDEHVRRRARLADLRRQVEELRCDLYEQQVAVRRILDGAFGPDRGFELASISGTTPRTAKALEEQVDQTVKILRKPVDEVPAVRVAGVTVDLDEVAGGLEENLSEFRARRRTLDRARKAVGESKVLLDRAVGTFQGSFPWIARAVESHFRIAGQHALADLVRAAIRRVTRRRRAEPEERAALDPESAGAPPAGEAVADEAAGLETETSEVAAEGADGLETETGSAATPELLAFPVRVPPATDEPQPEPPLRGPEDEPLSR